MKRLQDVAVRMRPRVPRAVDGAPQTETADAPEMAEDAAAVAPGFAARGDGPRIPARRPFMPSSRDLARQAAEAADAAEAELSSAENSDGTFEQDAIDEPQPTSASAEMSKPTGGSDRPISVPRRQIWDLEPDELEEVASHAVVTDRTYLPDQDDAAADMDTAAADISNDGADPFGTLDDAQDGDADEEDMANRALKALKKAEKQLEARGIPAEALYREDGAKTRVLGFHTPDLQTDAIEAVARKSVGDVRFPAGWIVVVDGPGRGANFAVTNSVSSIGRGLDQSICLNFGDASVSRSNHAAIAYDAEQNRFFLGHGNKSNIVRRNGQPVLSTEELLNGDEIRIGKTTLRFVALCGPDFTWGSDIEEDGLDDG